MSVLAYCNHNDHLHMPRLLWTAASVAFFSAVSLSKTRTQEHFIAACDSDRRRKSVARLGPRLENHEHLPRDLLHSPQLTFQRSNAALGPS